MAANIGKAQFESYLAAVGTVALWQVRKDAIPASSSDISKTAGWADPSDSGFIHEEADPLVYSQPTDLSSPAHNITVIKGKDAELLGNEFGDMIGGMTTAYCLVTDAVNPPDFLTFDGDVWEVKQAHVPTPPIYRRLVLSRHGAA